MKHLELSRRVMEMLLSGEDRILSLLRKQYENSKVVSIEDSPAGFFINYKVDEFVLDEVGINDNFHIGDVDGTVNGIDYAVGFVLFIKKGRIEMLEGYTAVMDTWPMDEEQIELSYNTKEERDISHLKRKWLN